MNWYFLLQSMPALIPISSYPYCVWSLPCLPLSRLAVDRVKKREQKKLVRYSAMLKSNKRILMLPSRLTEAKLVKLEEIFRVSDDLRKAYQLKQEFIHIFERQGKERIMHHLEWWLKSVKTAQLPEFRNFSISFVS